MGQALESQGFTLGVQADTDTPGAYTLVGGLTSFSLFDGAASEIDTTTLSDTAKTRIMGLQDYGSSSFDLNYLPEDAGQALVRGFKASRSRFLLQATFSDGATIEWAGFMTTGPITGSVDAKLETSFTVLTDGDITIEDAP